MSFRAKLIAGVLAIQLLMLLALVGGFSTQLRETYETELAHRADSAANLLAAGMTDALVAHDLATINALAGQAARAEGVKYVRVLNENGAPLAAFGAPRWLQRPFNASAGVQDLHDNVLEREAVVQLAGQVFGRVQIGIDGSHFVEQEKQTLQHAQYIALAGTLAVLLFASLLGGLLTRQLRALRRAAERVATGQFGQTLPVSGNDDLARLTRSFNHMSQELAERIGRSQAVLDSLSEGVLGIAPDGRCHFVNPAAAKLLGYRPEELLSEVVHDIIHHSYADGSRYPRLRCRMMAGAQSGDSDLVTDEVLWHKNGSAIPVEYRSVAIRVGEQSQGVVVAFHDISQRLRSEREMRILQRAVDSSPVTICVTAPDGRIEYINPAGLETTGYTRDDVIGEYPSLFQSGHTPLETYHELWNTVLAGDTWRGELQNRRSNGELYWERLQISPITDERGNITHFVAVKEDITQIRQLQQELEHRASYDALTGLLNRQKFTELLHSEVARAKRHGHPLGLIMFDVDHFKHINDEYGHDVGDTVLQQISQLAQQRMRISDHLARWGGEEFMVLLPETDGDGAMTIAEDLRRAIGEHDFPRVGRVTISLGCIDLSPEADLELMLKCADEALYRAKGAGRDRVVCGCTEKNCCTAD